VLQPRREISLQAGMGIREGFRGLFERFEMSLGIAIVKRVIGNNFDAAVEQIGEFLELRLSWGGHASGRRRVGDVPSRI
jgi:hypothetical protein